VKTYLPIFLFVAVFSFYLATLAPTVLWGDEAYFQRTAFESTLKPDGGGHWLWLRVAHLFIGLPWGDVAYRVNMLSALTGALTVVFLYAAVRALGLSLAGAMVAAISLAVAHTFWTFAVRAEVYTLFTLLMALMLWLWLSWRPDRPGVILVAALLFGVTLLGHQMAVLLLPTFAFLLWNNRMWLNSRQWILLTCLSAVGLVFFFIVLQWQSGGGSVLQNLRLHFTHSSDDFTDSLFDFSLTSLPRDTVMWLGLLGLQFVGLAGLLALLGLIDIRHKGLSAPWAAMLLLYGMAVLFAFSYHVNDQFVFYLPSYLVFAPFVGRGWEAATEAWPQFNRPVITPILLAILVMVPIVCYSGSSRLFAAANVNPLGIRELPGREPHSFFLWPAKNGYMGAADFGRSVLETLPPNGTLIADFTPGATIHYYISVEGFRPDVRLLYTAPGRDLMQLLERIPSESAVFLADNNPEYYHLRSVSDVELEPVGIIYRLRVKSP
jgi:hypothetical protein